MAFDRPTLLEIVQRITTDIMTKVTGAITFLRRSVFKVFAKVIGGAIHLVYGYLDQMVKQLFVDTADTTYLEMLGSEIGITRTAGAKATGGTKATGTNGTIIDAGTRVQSSSGNVYLVDTAATIAAGTANLTLTAEEVGVDYNEVAGVTLSFVTPISGVDTDTIVDSNGLTGGLDEESDDNLRERILLRKRQPPHGGSIYDYELWALEVAGVTRTWIIPEYLGIGTIGMAFVRDDDSSIIPTSAQMTTVENYIFSHTDTLTGQDVGIPVTAEAGFYMIPLTALAIDLNIEIYPNTNAIQAAVRTQLDDCIKEFGGPGETVAISQLYEAIGAAVGEIKHRIINPVADITAATNQVQVLGSITFGDYT